MPKLKNPPQGGEKYLCLTLFLTMFLSVVSAVAIIYSIVIIYLPSKIVLESNITGKNIDLVSLWVINMIREPQRWVYNFIIEQDSKGYKN